MTTFTSKATRPRLGHVGGALILLGGAMLTGGLAPRAEAAGSAACPDYTEYESCGPYEPEPYPTTTTTPGTTSTTEAATTTTTTTTQPATTTTEVATTTTQPATTTTQAATTTTTAIASAGPTTTTAIASTGPTTTTALASAGTLPPTGSSPQGLLVIGALLTLLGFVVVIVGRGRAPS